MPRFVIGANLLRLRLECQDTARTQGSALSDNNGSGWISRRCDLVRGVVPADLPGGKSQVARMSGVRPLPGVRKALCSLGLLT